MKRFLRVFAVCSLLIVFCLAGFNPSFAQTATPLPVPSATPYPLPAPNALLVYDHSSATLINIASTPLSLAGFGFMRAGDVVKLSVASYSISTLAPGHCVEWWLSSVGSPAKPAQCAVRDRFGVLSKDTTYFWTGSYANEPFRPELQSSALTVCNTSATQCLFHIPQGDEAKQPWVVLDPDSGLPLPAGIQVAYDANQIWIGNFTPNTLFTTDNLRIFYMVNGKGSIWTPSRVQWDGLGTWDRRGLAAGQCLVMYKDPTKIVPILPCTPVAQTLNADQPWTLAFDVMGPREERRSPCGQGKPTPGPVLCLIGG